MPVFAYFLVYSHESPNQNINIESKKKMTVLYFF